MGPADGPTAQTIPIKSRSRALSMAKAKTNTVGKGWVVLGGILVLASKSGWSPATAVSRVLRCGGFGVLLVCCCLDGCELS